MPNTCLQLFAMLKTLGVVRADLEGTVYEGELLQAFRETVFGRK